MSVQRGPTLHDLRTTGGHTPTFVGYTATSRGLLKRSPATAWHVSCECGWIDSTDGHKRDAERLHTRHLRAVQRHREGEDTLS